MLRHVATLAGLFIVFYFLAKGIVMYGPFSYDEADYMYAVSQGFVANCTDSPTLPLTELVRTGLGRGRDASRRTELSEMIRSSDDMVFYRHWHGPLYIDWLAIAKSLAWSEQSMRALNFIFPVATALLLYFGALWIIPGASGQIAAIIGAVLFLWSFPVISANELAPHELYVLCAAGTLLLLAKLLVTDPEAKRDARQYWYGAVVATALAFCTLEIAFVLIATVLICGHAVRDRLRPDLAFGLKSIGAFVLTVLMVWPAAILKLSFIKAYLFMAYLALFRKGAWGRDISVAETWWLRFVTSPVPWILLAIAIVILVYRRSELWSPALLPFAVYSVSMFLAILRVNTEFPRYVLPLFPGIVLFAAFTLGLWLKRFRPLVQYAAVGLIALAMFLTTLPQLRALPRKADPKAFAMLDLIRANGLAGKKLLVPYGDLPALHYYFPKTRFRGYKDEREVSEALRLDAFDGVIHNGDPPRIETSILRR